MPFESLRALSRSTMLTALSPSKGMVEGRIESNGFQPRRAGAENAERGLGNGKGNAECRTGNNKGKPGGEPGTRRGT